MKLETLDEGFSICKVKDFSQINLNSELYFISKTDREFALICPTSRIPENTISCEHGWRAFRLGGQLDFKLVGILSKIAVILAGENIPILAYSTFETDYIFTKIKDFDHALKVLKEHGYEVEE
ncbi:MAG: ACT domain-containing protein [Eubacterium sp.]|nr:ACT domain-containing protein [Eubacterium sp.]